MFVHFFFHETTAHLSVSHTYWLQCITRKTAIIPGLFYYISMSTTVAVTKDNIMLNIKIYTLYMDYDKQDWKRTIVHCIMKRPTSDTENQRAIVAQSLS